MPPVAGFHVSVRWRYSIQGTAERIGIPRIPQRTVYGDDILIEQLGGE